MRGQPLRRSREQRQRSVRSEALFLDHTYTAKAFEALTAGTLIYLVLCVGIASVMGQVERYFRIPGLIARVGRAEH